MKKLLLAAALLTVSNVAIADKGVDSAYKLCMMIDSTGLATKDCDVSAVWGGKNEIIMTADMVSSEARKLCVSVTKAYSENLKGEWKFIIRSPYSNGNNIAQCNF